ncbi:uncharacterized protein LOC131807322 [Mustela lutreola]|uniref:uncharacterized protein LOC131807322 n=1 Tax=Mustela lutreola TaxID=9666 RepID=UPI002796FC8E|nr:uncharacterized protein LOC131807322 [Mustela lutreola]
METDKGGTKPQAFQKLEEARKDPAWSLQMVSFCAGCGVMGGWGLGWGVGLSPCQPLSDAITSPTQPALKADTRSTGSEGPEGSRPPVRPVQKSDNKHPSRKSSSGFRLQAAEAFGRPVAVLTLQAVCGLAVGSLKQDRLLFLWSGRRVSRQEGSQEGCFLLQEDDRRFLFPWQLPSQTEPVASQGRRHRWRCPSSAAGTAFDSAPGVVRTAVNSQRLAGCLRHPGETTLPRVLAWSPASLLRAHRGLERPCLPALWVRAAPTVLSC